MSVASELTRIKGAKNDLKASINAKTDSEHQITNETIDEYADFVDSITSGGGGLDWSAIGYESTPQSIVDYYNYALEIKNNWQNVANLKDKFRDDKIIAVMPLVDTSNATTMENIFYNCSNLIEVPILNTENVTNLSYAFNACSSLTRIPLLNTNKVTVMKNVFYGCANLHDIPVLDTSKIVTGPNFKNAFFGCISMTDTSLDNVLQMCINATSYTGTKTLAYLGFSSNYYSANKISSMPHYQDFLTAGWTIGY